MSSWPSRLVLAVLALQLASACKPAPTPPPTGNPDTTPPSTRANPQGGNFTASVTVTLTCEDGAGSGCAATYFTTDGSPPSASSQRYTSPVAVSKSTTLKFYSVDAAGNAEAPQTQSYVVDQEPPVTVATPSGGVLNSARTVALLCMDGDGAGSGCAATYFTTDGSVPTTGSPRYTAPLLVSASTTLRFFSVDAVGNTEAAKTEQYTLDDTAPTVMATPAGGTYATAQTVTLSCDDGAGTGCRPIHYTTDGSAPSMSSPEYTTALVVSTPTTLRFLAQDGAGNVSPPVSAVYVIDDTGPATTATPAGAIYNTPVSVTLKCDDGVGSGCAGTYFTTDGSPPTTGSARYTTAIPITSTSTLKFFSVDKLGNPGPTGTSKYTLDFSAPITTANPPGGTYSSAQTVALQCTDGAGVGCAATYYTLDGTTPTRGSPRYTTPLRITTNTTLRFFSVDSANNTESVRTEVYDLDSVPPVTRATPAGGLYKSNQSVVLGCDDGVGSGCVETHYTLDGSTPTLASPKYTSAILLTGNTALKFFSVDAAGNQEDVQTETYTIDTVAPSTTASPAAGTYGSTVSVTLACDDGASGSGCAETHYTVDGTAPTTHSPLYTSALSLTATTTLRYFSTDKAGNKEPTRVALYTLDQVAPTVSASPRGGLFNKTQSITLTCADTGGSTCDAIHYTTDGTTPTTASATYSAPLAVSATTTLKFLAVDKVGNASGVQTETYRIDDAAPVTTAIRAGGAYASAQSVTLLCADGAGSGCSATYYTLDGSTPTTGSSRYASPISITANATLRFLSVDAAGNAESPRSEAYIIDAVSPTVSADPVGGTYNSARSVTLTCTDNTDGSGCAAIHYTTDGTSPTMSSPLYTGPLTLSGNTPLRFFAVDAVGNVSAARYESYVIDTGAPVTTIYPSGGTYTAGVNVYLTCSDDGGSGCAAIHYTTDGSTPTTSSPVTTGYFYFTATTTLKFFSVDVAGNAEAVRTETYVIIPDTTPPTTTAYPPGDSYTSPQAVSLSCSDDFWCSATYYTLDGSTPTTASPRYSGGYLSISSNTTLKFFSVDAAGNAEPVRTETYVFGPDTKPPTTSASPAGGTYSGALYVYLSCADNSWCDSTYYTLDGSTPTTASLRYSGSIYISSTTTLKFFSVDGYGNAEAVRTETYTFVPDTTPPSTYAYPAGGTYDSPVYVYLNCSDNAWCAATYYTLDGSTPTTASPQYPGYLYISSTTTLKFFSVDGAGNAEPVHTETYVFGPDVTPPTTYASPAGGTYTTPRYVYLYCYDNTSCANTYYTLDGSTPTTASPRYSGSLYISRTTTLKFFSVDGAGNAEAVRTETYVFAPDTTPPTTYASLSSGTYTGAQYISLSCYDDSWCDSTYYTLDGSTPTIASPRFSDYLYISSTTTLKFFSVDGAGNAEPVHTETYVITPDTVPPFTYATPAGGTYTAAQFVSLTCTDNGWCDNTYYTLDGSTPTTASPRYSGNLYIPTNATLKFFSVDRAGNAEPVRTETYVINTDPSAQIALIRTRPDGAISEPIDGALVTYTKASTGPTDPAGFFLQGSATGPALFVAIDPLTFFPSPQPGDRVTLHATQKATVNGTVELTQIATGSFSFYSTGESVEPFRTDVSGSDLVLNLADYESELVSFSGTVASDFASAGTGHVSANVVSLGNSSVNPNLKLRITSSLQSTLDVTQGCSITTNAPLWRFNTQAQPSAWASGDLTVLSCPAPRVTGATATSGTNVVVAFDRRVDPASVNTSGGQFTFDNGLVATSATVSDRQVQLTTSSQVGGTTYRLTVAPSIRDTRGTALDGSANSATFTGYTPTPGVAQLRLTEVSPGITNGRDLVELIAVKGGSVNGFTLSLGSAVMATFPNVQVATGDIIVVHLKPDSATNGDATGSETTSKSQFPASTYSANYDTAWDFLSSTSFEIGYSRRVLRVWDATGLVQDGAAFGRTGGTPPGDFLTQLQYLQEEGQWLPASCGGVACSDTTSPTALDVSVDWAGCGTTRGGNSVRRISATDTNMRGDWAVGTSSFGLANP